MEKPSSCGIYELKQTCNGQGEDVGSPSPVTHTNGTGDQVLNDGLKALVLKSVVSSPHTVETVTSALTNGVDHFDLAHTFHNSHLEPDLLRCKPDVIIDHECQAKNVNQTSDIKDISPPRDHDEGNDCTGHDGVNKELSENKCDDIGGSSRNSLPNGCQSIPGPDLCCNIIPSSLLKPDNKNSCADSNASTSHNPASINCDNTGNEYVSYPSESQICETDASVSPSHNNSECNINKLPKIVEECDAHVLLHHSENGDTVASVSHLHETIETDVSHLMCDDQLYSVKKVGMKTYLEENIVMFDCPDEDSPEAEGKPCPDMPETDDDQLVPKWDTADPDMGFEGSSARDSPSPEPAESWFDDHDMAMYDDSPIPRVHIQHSDNDPDLEDDFIDDRSRLYPGNTRCYSPVDVQLRSGTRLGMNSYLEDEPMYFDGPDDDSGQEVQRISVINNLPDLLRDNHAECMRRVVPKVREVLHVAQAEMQLAASSAFLQILQKELVPIQNYTQTFLQTILISVDSKDPDVANAWLETLLDVIDLLPKDVIKKDILSIAVAKGQLSQSVQARLACSRILGKISTKFEPFVIKKEILPVVQSMCQDIDYEVRGCMCRQLDPVARGLGLEATKSAILPELVELTNDEESHVRIAGLETVVNILSLLDDETCKNTIVPLVCKFCQQSMLSEDTTLPVVAKQFGKLCHGLSINLTDEQKLWLLDYYRQLCRVGLSDKAKLKETEPSSPPKVNLMGMGMDMFEEEDKTTECRRHAAFNFPAMVMFAGGKSFKSELNSTFSHLCTDPNMWVRKSVASGFHEVAKFLGVNVTMLQSDLVKLLKDESPEVLKGVVAHLPQTLEILAKGGGPTITESKMNHLAEIIPSLMAAEKVIFSSNNWRLQEELMTNLSCLPNCFTSDAIFNKIIPMMYKNVRKARALPVRHAAGRTLLILIRNIKKMEYREECYSNLIEDFCHSSSCYQRGLFIDLCKVVIDLYSKKFFKEHFYEAVLELTTDPVPNIRLKLCSILPQLKKIVKVPSDRALLQNLEGCVRKLLINEKDRDVNACVKQAVEELDRIHVQMETIKKRMYFEDDLADERKEGEERQLIEQEERERKEEEAKPKSEKKKDTSKKDNGGSKIPSPRRASTGSKATGSTSREKLSSAGRDLKKTPSTSSNVTGTTSSTRNSMASSKSPMAKPASRSNAVVSSASSSNRKPSTSSGSSSILARRGSINSASSTSSESSAVSQKSAGASRKISSGATTPTTSSTAKKKTSVK